MAKHQNKTGSRKKVARKSGIPVLPVKPGASLKSIYAAARRAFTAADLQKFTEIEEGIPARELLAELEAIDKKDSNSLKRRRR